MPRVPLDFKPMADRVAVIVGPHRALTIYELDPIAAELLMLDLKRAVETARDWATK